MARSLKRFSSILITAAISSLVFVAPAAAVSRDGLSVWPSGTARTDFRYRIDASTPAHDQLRLTNASDRPLTVSLYAVDARTSNTGAFALRNRTEPRSDVAAWIALSRSSVVIPSHRTVAVDFELHVPPDAAPGDHSGGIVAELAPTPTNRSTHGVQVEVIRRFGVRVTATVPGAQTRRIELSGFTLRIIRHRPQLTILLHNRGTTVVTARGETRLRSFLHRDETLPLSGIILLPHQSTSVAVSGATMARIVFHPHASLELEYGASAPLRAETVIWWFDWPLITALSVLILITVIGLRHRDRRRSH